MSKNRRFSQMFFFIKESEKETIFNILDTKKCFLDLKSEVLKKVQKSDILHHMFVLRKESLKNTFFNIPDRKEWFLDPKSEVLKQSEK